MSKEKLNYCDIIPGQKIKHNLGILIKPSEYLSKLLVTENSKEFPEKWITLDGKVIGLQEGIEYETLNSTSKTSEEICKEFLDENDHIPEVADMGTSPYMCCDEQVTSFNNHYVLWLLKKLIEARSLIS